MLNTIIAIQYVLYPIEKELCQRKTVPVQRNRFPVTEKSK